MKRKNEKGAITLFVLIAGLSFITFLTTILAVGAVRKQAQIEATKQAKAIYSQGDANSIYENFFVEEGAVPVYNFSQLMQICSGNQVTINEEGGKIYTYAPDAVYVLMDDIVGEYNGVWSIPTFNSNGGRIESNGKAVSIKDTSKSEEVYYYYNSINDFAFPVTDEGYAYAGLALHYDGINNTGNGHSDTITTWKDLSGNGNNGIINNGTIEHDAVKLKPTTSNANNANIITQSQLPQFTIANAQFTISMVFELTEMKDFNANNYASLFGRNNFRLYNDAHSGMEKLCLYTNSNNTGTRRELCDSLNYGETYFLTLVFSNGTLNFYMNGELVTTVDAPNQTISNNYLYIFSSTGGFNSTGKIHNFKWYNSALTEAEVISNYDIDQIRYIKQNGIPPVYAIAYANNGDNSDIELVFNSTGEVDSTRSLVLKTNNILTNYYKTETSVPWYSIRSNIKIVTFENKIQPFFTSYYFRKCTNLTTINNIINLDTTHVQDMQQMFYDCRGLTNLNLTHFSTSSVKSMYMMFYGCSGLSNLDLTSFDTRNVNNMGYMFQSCNNLTELDLTRFNTSNVTSMTNMFYGCSKLTELDLSRFDTRNVTQMGAMFMGCSGFTHCNKTSTNSNLNISNFNTSKVTSMTNMFQGCSNLVDLDLSFFDTSNVTSMGNMFNGCSCLTHNDWPSQNPSLNISSFNTSKVTSMYGMFQGCSSLTRLNLEHFDTSNVTNMSSMFASCSCLTHNDWPSQNPSLNISSFNTSKVTSMSSMFSGCSGLTRLNLGHFNTSKVTSMGSMFNGCSGLTRIDLGDNFDTSSVTSMSYMLLYSC